MKQDKLIAMLQSLPEDAEIVIMEEYDNIMCRHYANFDIAADETTLYGWVNKKGNTVWEGGAGSGSRDITKKVWELR